MAGVSMISRITEDPNLKAVVYSSAAKDVRNNVLKKK
jgi:hypothetical protein